MGPDDMVFTANDYTLKHTEHSNTPRHENTFSLLVKASLVAYF